MPSDSKGNDLSGDKLWLLGFVLVDDNLRSVCVLVQRFFV